jgi:hypothetical protein
MYRFIRQQPGSPGNLGMAVDCSLASNAINPSRHDSDAMRCAALRACMRPSSCSRAQLCQAPAGIVEEAVMMLMLMGLSMNHSFAHSLTHSAHFILILISALVPRLLLPLLDSLCAYARMGR